MRILVIILFGIVSFSVKAGDSDSTVLSPNKSYRVKISEVRVPNGDNPYTYNVIRVFRGELKIGEYSLKETETESPRSVYDYKWSPDSRFLVILTHNVHGSSIWHSPTTVYDTVTNRFIDLDQHLGAIVDDRIEFQGHDTLRIKVLGPDGADGEPLVKEVSLVKLAEQK